MSAKKQKIGKKMCRAPFFQPPKYVLIGIKKIRQPAAMAETSGRDWTELCECENLAGKEAIGSDRGI